MRILTTTLALAAAFALCGCPTDGSSGNGGGGDLACDSGLNTRVTCPTDPNVHNLTGVQALNALKDAFEAQFPTVTWMGGIAGVSIGRDGKTADKGPVVTISGFSMEYGSGWTGNFCTEQGAVDDSLNYDTTDGKCTAVRSCQAVNCNAVPTTYAFPVVDTPAAIEAAFPTDPAGTWYNVTLVLGNGTKWTIQRMGIEGATAESKYVDAITGAVTAVP